MLVYQTNYDGFYTGEVEADKNPLDHNDWLIPAGCVLEKPPDLTETQVARWTGIKWEIIENVKYTDTELAEYIRMLRKVSYAEEADSLFFKWQAGEIQKSVWLEKRKEIKTRYTIQSIQNQIKA